MKTYYDYLSNELNNYSGDFDKFVLYTPDFFRLLCDMMDQNIDKEDRRLINTALAYFVLPNDYIPENIYGPMGYADDIFVCVKVLQDLKDKYGKEILISLWQNEEDFEEALQTSYEKSKMILDEHGLLEQVVQYIGL